MKWGGALEEGGGGSVSARGGVIERYRPCRVPWPPSSIRSLTERERKHPKTRGEREGFERQAAPAAWGAGAGCPKAVHRRRRCPLPFPLKRPLAAHPGFLALCFHQKRLSQPFKPRSGGRRGLESGKKTAQTSACAVHAASATAPRARPVATFCSPLRGPGEGVPPLS